MKNLIYLPLIALIVLTGCKENSFMTQRYTKFGHACQKNSIEEKMVRTKSDRNEVQKSTENRELLKQEETQENLVCSISTKENTPIAQPRFLISNTKTKIENPFTENYSKSASLVKSETKNLKSKKTFHERSSAAKGLIDSALGLVVTIIVLVVVIVLVIILVAAIL